MTTYLSADYIEHHITPLSYASIPEGWHIDSGGQYYQLDLKMCQISALHFDFQWGKERGPASRLASVLDTPSRILRLDISLNDLTFLHHDWLLPFLNLRCLDASLNQLKHFQGIEVLPQLHVLNLSHNALRSVDGLAMNSSLTELRLAVNELQDISAMPSLINLRILDVSNNKLKSLLGISSLPKLQELYAYRNELTDLLPVMSCGQLHVLNVANNSITSLDTILKVLSNLKVLQVLSLHGNPVEREYHYQADILRATNITTLDNVSVRPMPRREEDHKKHSDNLYSLKNAARQAFQDRLRVAKERLDDNVSFLQRRIIALQQEHLELEAKLKADLESCLRYLDSLSETEMTSGDRSDIGAVLKRSDFMHPWRDSETHAGGSLPRTDYSQVKQTDEVLRCAYNELIKQKSELP